MRRLKIKWFLLRLQSHLLAISRNGLYFYIMQLPIRPNCWLSSILDQIFGLILKIRHNSGLILKIRPSACCHLNNLCKLGLRPEFGLRTKCGLFFQVTQCLGCSIAGCYLLLFFNFFKKLLYRIADVHLFNTEIGNVLFLWDFQFLSKVWLIGDIFHSPVGWRDVKLNQSLFGWEWKTRLLCHRSSISLFKFLTSSS